MPSNADIIKSITEEAEAKGIDMPEVEGKKNDELADILTGLKKSESKLVQAAKIAAAEKAEAEKKQSGHFVKKGKAITTKRGILSDGQKITDEDLAGGKDALSAFVKSGYIEKR